MGKWIDALIGLAVYGLGCVSAFIGLASIALILLKRNQALTAMAKNDGRP